MTPAGPTDAPGHEAFASFDPRYVVERELGRGAMGRVFLARDLRLDRLVAIKALAPGLQDAIDLRRLEQEARAAGSLNHPNIVAVHDIGTAEGRPFIVSEYLRGETLRQKLEVGPLPWAQALDFGLQLARGLTAAHERGIVHRDLKPENLFVTEDGWLKILDFGIAKREAQTGPEADTPPRLTPPQLEALHSALPPLTSPGEILGTVGYMSPEQVLGQPADARSDIFAFGTILYEMLSGARAFHRERTAATSFAILRDEPSPLPETVPARLRETAARCLRKVPAQRFASARELAAALDELRPTGELAAVGRASRSRPWLIAVAVLSLALAGAGAFTAWKVAHRDPPSFRQLTFHPGAVWSARFGPDGKQVFYSAAWEATPPKLFMTTPGDPEATRLPLPDGQLLAVSATGELAVLLHPNFKGMNFGEGTLAIASGRSGVPKVLQERVDFADFAPDGSIALIRQDGARSQLEFPVGHVLASTFGRLGNLRVSPSGALVAFVEHPHVISDSGAVKVVDLAGNVRTLADALVTVQGLAWSKTGDEVWFTAGESKTTEYLTLLAVSLRGQRRRLMQVAGDLRLEDVGRDGRVLVTQPNARHGLALVEKGSTQQRDLSWFDRSFLSDLTPDGTKVLMTVAGPASTPVSSVYVRSSDGSPARYLTDNGEGALTPDGRFALVLPIQAGQPFLLFPAAGGAPRQMAGEPITPLRVRFLPNGQQFIFVGRESGRPLRIYRRGLEETKSHPVSPEGVGGQLLAISPDGSRIATTNESLNTVIVSLADGNVRALKEIPPGEGPMGWSRDGGLYVGRPLQRRLTIDRVDLANMRRTPWWTVSPQDPSAIFISRVLMTPSGESLAYNYAAVSTHLYMLNDVD
jgi:Tol biopolymer transport system component